MTDQQASKEAACGEPRDWYRVELPYAVCAVASRKGVIVEAAPIMRWAIGKPVVAVLSWVRAREGRILNMAPESAPGGAL